MPTTIQLKRGLQANLVAASASDGEPLWTTDTHRLYVSQAGVKYQVGGNTYTFAQSLAEASGTVTLAGDTAAPGNSKYYGTDGTGARGWYDLPAGNPGTVTSVGLSAPALMSASGSPVTSGGTLGLAWAVPTARLLGRTTAGTGDAETITVGSGLSLSGSTLSCTAVTSVGLSAPALMSASGSPVTSSGTLGLAWAVPTARLLGRATAGTGDAEAVALGTGLSLSGGTLSYSPPAGSVGTAQVADGSITNAKLADGAVTNAKLADVAGPAVLGRATTGTGVVVAISGGSSGSVLLNNAGTLQFNTLDIGNTIGNLPTSRLSGAISTAQIADGAITAIKMAASAVGTATVIDGSLTYAKIQNMAATSVLGRSAGTSGTPAAISSTANGQVLQQSGGVLAFAALDIANTTGNLDTSRLTGGVTVADGSITTAKLANKAVTVAKMDDMPSTSVLCNATGSTGQPLAYQSTGSWQVLMSSFGNSSLAWQQVNLQNTTGQVNNSQIQDNAIGASKIADGAVTAAKLASLAATSVLGRSAGTSGTPAAISSSADGQVLQQSGGALTFAALDIGSTTGSLPLSRLGPVSSGVMLGRSTAGSGAAEQITVGSGLSLSGGTLVCTVSPGTGTVTSVGLSLPAIFSVTGSPVTTSGTLTATLASQSANRILASPDGSSGAPTFRALVAADLPTVPASKRGFSGALIQGSQSVANTASFAGWAGHTACAQASPTITYDTDSYWSSGSPSRLTAPAAGYYRIWGSIQTATDWIGTSNNQTGGRSLRIRLNGSTTDSLASDYRVSTFSAETSCTVYLNSGDYVELFAGQGSGGARTTLYRFGIERVGV